MLLNKLTLLSLLYSVKEEVCNEVVIELSSASQLSWYMFDLFSVLLFFFWCSADNKLGNQRICDLLAPLKKAYFSLLNSNGM